MGPAAPRCLSFGLRRYLPTHLHTRLPSPPTAPPWRGAGRTRQRRERQAHGRSRRGARMLPPPPHCHSLAPPSPRQRPKQQCRRCQCATPEQAAAARHIHMYVHTQYPHAAAARTRSCGPGRRTNRRPPPKRPRCNVYLCRLHAARDATQCDAASKGGPRPEGWVAVPRRAAPPAAGGAAAAKPRTLAIAPEAGSGRRRAPGAAPLPPRSVLLPGVVAHNLCLHRLRRRLRRRRRRRRGRCLRRRALLGRGLFKDVGP